MSDKLFDVEAKEVSYTIEIESYKFNKVFNKLIACIKKSGIYKLRQLDNELRPYSKAYEVTGALKGSREEFVRNFKDEIKSYIPDVFPANYHFDIRGTKGEIRLGFTASFNIYYMDKGDNIVRFYHLIKEQRTDGRSEPAKQVINDQYKDGIK